MEGLKHGFLSYEELVTLSIRIENHINDKPKFLIRGQLVSPNMVRKGFILDSEQKNMEDFLAPLPHTPTVKSILGRLGAIQSTQRAVQKCLFEDDFLGTIFSNHAQNKKNMRF